MLAQSMGSKLSAQELDETISSIDQNGDGEISFEELYDWFQTDAAGTLAKMIRKQCVAEHCNESPPHAHCGGVSTQVLKKEGKLARCKNKGS